MAYTSSRICFYKVIEYHCNEVLVELLQRPQEPRNTLSTSIFFLISALKNDSRLQPRGPYIGTVYRGQRMSVDYFQSYRKNELVVNRPFISTSKDPKVMNQFSGAEASKRFFKSYSKQKFLEISVHCTYKIRRPQTFAMDISKLSEMTGEDEVLIMPISVFRIISIGVDWNKNVAEVELEDCDLPSKDDPTAPIIRCDFAEFPRTTMVIPVVPV